MKRAIYSIIAILGLSTTVHASNFSNNILLESESVNILATTTANYYDQFLFEVQLFSQGSPALFAVDVGC